jgi:hypothetical protein
LQPVIVTGDPRRLSLSAVSENVRVQANLSGFPLKADRQALLIIG